MSNTDISSALESLQKNEESNHKLIIVLLIVLIVVILIYMFYNPCKSNWTNCMLPQNLDEAARMWKAAGVSDEEIKWLIGTYFPLPKYSDAVDKDETLRNHKSKWNLSDKSPI